MIPLTYPYIVIGILPLLGILAYVFGANQRIRQWWNINCVYHPTQEHDTAIRAEERDKAIREYRMKESSLSSVEILNLAANDWHRREERRGIHAETPFVAGWITGFLTPEKPDWNKVRERAVKADERIKVLDEVRDRCTEKMSDKNPEISVVMLSYILDDLRPTQEHP
jgi:hypothetical protein